MCVPGAADGDAPSKEAPLEDIRQRKPAADTYAHSKKVGNYLIGRDLGAGSFAKVREALHVLTGELVAVKIVSKESAKTDAYVAKNMRREGRILQLIRHSNVVRLLEVMETENSYYLVLELCRGGDLMTHLSRRRRLMEAEARRLLRQMVQAVDYMHSLGILHRDLKMENLLLTQDQNLKIIDFGLSNMVQAVPDENGNIVTQLCRTQCGSPAYAAPEVLAKKPYGTAVDIWSIGVNMFAMLSGNLPFTVKPFNIKALYQKMVNQDFNPLPRGLTASCQDLLMRLLNPQPETRIKLRDVMGHPWMNENLSRLRPSPFPNLMTSEDLRQDILEQASQQLAMPVCDVRRKVLDNTPSPCLATYSLMVQKLDRCCRQNPIAKIQSQAPSSQVSSEPKEVIGAKFCCAAISSDKEPAVADAEIKPGSLPLRRERTLAVTVPVSVEATEAMALVKLDGDACRPGDASAQTPRLPRCPAVGATERRTQSDRGCHTARVAVAAAVSTPAPPPPMSSASPVPLRRIRTDVGRSSIQSLVSQRYAPLRTAVHHPVPHRYHPTAFSALPARRPSLISANIKAAAAAARQPTRFSSTAALRGAAAITSNPFSRR